MTFSKFLSLPWQDHLVIIGIPVLIILYFIVTYKEKNLNGVKDIKVGDGQYGSARWITEKEKKQAFEAVLFEPEKWRNGENKENLKQGLLLGINKGIALVDTSDANTVLVGPAGIGKTKFFLMPQLEYAAASGMNFLVTDTKGYAVQTIANILTKCYGYNVKVINLVEPLKSDHYNLMQVLNHYMAVYKKSPNTQTGLKAEAKAQKYAKIIAASIIESAGFKGGGENSYFYDSAEGIITSSILLISEFGNEGEKHIISVFKLIQELSKNISNKEDQNKDLQTEFAKLVALLPENHKAKWFAGSAVEADIKTALSVFATALSKITKFIDSELEQIVCFDSTFSAEDFVNKKTAVFFVLPEDDRQKHFMFNIFIMQLYRELIMIADNSKDKQLPNRVMFYEDELGTIPAIQDLEMVFSASRSRNILSVPMIQSFSQLKKNYGEEGKDIILDNCQNVLFSGFGPKSTTPEELSRVMDNYTTQAGSVGYSWNSNVGDKSSQNLSKQMVGRALMTPGEIRGIKKGDFVLLKTGLPPTKLKIPYYGEWGGLKFEDDFIASEKDIQKPQYISIKDLKERIVKYALGEDKKENKAKESKATTSEQVQVQEKEKQVRFEIKKNS